MRADTQRGPQQTANDRALARIVTIEHSSRAARRHGRRKRRFFWRWRGWGLGVGSLSSATSSSVLELLAGPSVVSALSSVPTTGNIVGATGVSSIAAGLSSNTGSTGGSPAASSFLSAPS